MYKFIGVACLLLLAAPVSATTICFDGKTMASDSRCTAGHTVLLANHKIRRFDKRKITVGGAGEVYLLKQIFDYLEQSDKPLEDLKDLHRKNAESGFQLLVVNDDGSAVHYLDDLQCPENVEPPFAIGSGTEFALAAMRLGKSAAGAVEFTATCDTLTGGEVHIYSIPPKR